MAASDTFRVSDVVPWSPISAPASIFPALAAPAQDDVGTAWIGELGGPVPFGCDLVEPVPEDKA